MLQLVAIRTYYCIVIILLALSFVAIVGGCPIVTSVNGSYCGISSNEFKFSTMVKSGVYNITNFCGDCEQVAEGYCDVSTAGGGWLIIRRRDKLYSTNFCRGWMEYVDGFGDLNKEFWYGLKPICCLTNQGKGSYVLTLHLKMVQHPYLQYNHFKIK